MSLVEESFVNRSTVDLWYRVLGLGFRVILTIARLMT